MAVNDSHLGDMLETGAGRRFHKGTDSWRCHCILGWGGTEMVAAVGGLYLDHGGDCRTWALHRIHSPTTCYQVARSFWRGQVCHRSRNSDLLAVLSAWVVDTCRKGLSYGVCLPLVAMVVVEDVAVGDDGHWDGNSSDRRLDAVRSEARVQRSAIKVVHVLALYTHFADGRQCSSAISGIVIMTGICMA